MTKSTRDARVRRHVRVREKVAGTGDRPRLCVFRSLSHIYAQVIDDVQGQTLVAASTLDADIKKEADTQAQKLIDDSSYKGTLAKMAAQKAADSLRKNADTKATQIEKEADVQAIKLVDQAKAQKEELIKKI